MHADTIVLIHSHLTDFFLDKDDPISPPGVKDRNTVESAAARPMMSVAGQDAYPTVFLKAAALFHSIAGNHSFYNGNKRTALLSTLYFLNEHGYSVDLCHDDEMFEFTRQIAAHEITADRNNEVTVIASWLERYSQIRQKSPKEETQEVLNRLIHLRLDVMKRLAKI